MKENNFKLTKEHRAYTNSFHKERNSLKAQLFTNIPKEKDNLKSINFHKTKMRSDSKIINFSEMIPQLLEKIKSSRHSIYPDNGTSNSFINESNSSEINDDKESENDIFNINNSSGNKISNSPKKLPKIIIEKKEEDNEYKNLERSVTYREQRNYENSPKFEYRKYSKENKDCFILKMHKYFFQDGDIENIDTLIQYNLNKIKINDNYNNEENSNQNLSINNNDNLNENSEFDYFIIKQNIINLMDKFAEAFDKGNKNLLISAIKDLSNFSEKYKFDYVTQLTLDCLLKIQNKEYENCELKYIGYYNQIRDIIDKMLKELKKKADLIIISKLKNKNKNNINQIKNNDNINNINRIDISNSVKVPSIIMNKNLQKKNSINKEDIFKTKEIVPIKIDIEVKNSLNINEVEEILKNLDEGDLGNFGSKKNLENNKKLLNKHNNNRNDNELEAFSYPFKEDNLCNIF